MQGEHWLDRETLLLCFHSRKSRAKAIAVAREEAVQLLAGFGAHPLAKGPLVEEGVKIWISLPASKLQETLGRLATLGYSDRVDALIPVGGQEPDLPRNADVRWNRAKFSRFSVTIDNSEVHRSEAPDQRRFLLEMSDGSISEIRGYRGSWALMERRGLAVADARLLVNLASQPNGSGTLLDPFAGVGGIALAAKHAGSRVITVDMDPKLRFGLERISGAHVVGDACALPFGTASFDMVATEPPFELAQGDLIARALTELSRVLRPNGKAALMLAEWQAVRVPLHLENLPFDVALNESVDRRGSKMVVLLLIRR